MFLRFLRVYRTSLNSVRLKAVGGLSVSTRRMGFLIGGVASVAFIPLTKSYLAGHVQCQADSSNDVVANTTAGVDIIPCAMSIVPMMPEPINRKTPATLDLQLSIDTHIGKLTNQFPYSFCSFNRQVPGPVLRARVGDTINLTLRNGDTSSHTIDFQYISASAPMVTVTSGSTVTASFNLDRAGFFLYRSSPDPTLEEDPVHRKSLASGLYGTILVEPENGLPPIDREYCVVQSEFYFDEPKQRGHAAQFNAQRRTPTAYYLNGHEGALSQDRLLQARADEHVRLYFANAGPRQSSTLRVVGLLFQRIYRDGCGLEQVPPECRAQLTSVAAGSTAVVEFHAIVPGVYELVDNSAAHQEKGAVGMISVTGKDREDIYYSDEGVKPIWGENKQKH